MEDQTKSDPDEAQVRAKLVSETAKIPWSELQRFFAAGRTLCVASELDLVDVAFAFQQDDAEQVRHWLKKSRVASINDAQARDWIKQDSILWPIVVKPWVPVQNLKK